MPWEQGLGLPPHSHGTAQGSQRQGRQGAACYRANFHHCWCEWLLPALLCQWQQPAEAAQVPQLTLHLFSTATVEEPFGSVLSHFGSVIQYGHTVFPSLDTHRISPFSLNISLSLNADCLDTAALLVSVFQVCNLPCQERVLARLPWVRPYPFPAPRLWTSLSFPVSYQIFKVNELGMGSPNPYSPRCRASLDRSLTGLKPPVLAPE